MLEKETWSKIKEEVPNRTIHGTPDSMLLDCPLLCSHCRLCLSDVPPCCLLEPVFKAAAVNSSAKGEMSHPHIAEVGASG